MYFKKLIQKAFLPFGMSKKRTQSNHPYYLEHTDTGYYMGISYYIRQYEDNNIILTFSLSFYQRKANNKSLNYTTLNNSIRLFFDKHT